MALAQRTLLSLLGATLWLSAATSSRAQDTAKAPIAPEQATSVEQELARTMFETAIEKSARGEWNDALELLIRSRALVDRPVTAMNQALMLARLSRMQEALQVLAEARALARAPEDEELLQRIEQLRAEIAPLVGELSVRITPSAASLSLDGKELGAGQAGLLVVAVDPGPHRLEAKAPDYLPTSVDLRLGRGERRTVELVLARTPVPQATSTPTPDVGPLEVGQGSHSERSERPLLRSARFWGPVGGVIVAGIITGVLIAVRSDGGSQSPDGGSSGRILSPP